MVNRMTKDRYTQWLKIPPGERPPDHYTLLGLPHFCEDAQRIAQASHDRLDELDKYSLSKDPASRSDCQRIMNEVARALVVLTDAGKRLAYDVKLAAKLGIAPPQAMIMPAQESPPISEPPRVQSVTAHEQPAQTTVRAAPVSPTARQAPAHAPQVAKRQRPVPLSAEPTTRWPLVLMLSVGGAALSVVALIVLLIVFMTQDRDPSLAPDVNAPYMVTPDPQPPDRLPPIPQPQPPIVDNTPVIFAHPEMEEARAKCMTLVQECRDDKSIMPLIDKWSQRDWQYIMTAIEQGEDVLATPASRTAQYERAFDKLVEVMTHARRTAEIIKATRGPYDQAVAVMDEETVRTRSPADWTSIQSSLRNATIGALNHRPEDAKKHFEQAAKTYRDSATKILAMKLPGVGEPKEPPVPLGSIRLVSVGKPFKGPHQVQYLQFSPNGKLLAASGYKEVLLWDVDAGKAHAVKSLLPEPKGIEYFSFSPDGGNLHNYTLESISTWNLSKLQEPPISTRWRTGGRLVLGGPYVGILMSDRNNVELWDVATSRPVTKLEHDSTVLFHAISDDGRIVITLDERRTHFHVWDPKKGQKVSTIPYPFSRVPGIPLPPMALRPDGRIIACGKTSLNLVATDGAVLVHQGLSLRGRSDGEINKLQYSPDGRRLLIGMFDYKLEPLMRSSLLLYDPTESRIVGEPHPTGDDGQGRFPKPTWRCSPDGKLLATGGATGILRIVNLEDGKPLIDDVNIGSTIWDIAFSPDNKLLAVLHVDPLVQIYRFDP